jgi:hypothetical protein
MSRNRLAGYWLSGHGQVTGRARTPWVRRPAKAFQRNWVLIGLLVVALVAGSLLESAVQRLACSAASYAIPSPFHLVCNLLQ